MFFNFFDFLGNFLIFATSDKRGWGYAPIWEMGVSMALYGDATTPRVFAVHKT